MRTQRPSFLLWNLALFGGVLLLYGCADDLEGASQGSAIEVEFSDNVPVEDPTADDQTPWEQPDERGSNGTESNEPVEDAVETPGEPAEPSEPPVLAEGECAVPGPYPGAQWVQSTPEEQGMDSTLLEEAASYAEGNDSHCMVVVRHGAIVGEWYWQGNTPVSLVKSWSVGKSYASAVVGVAIDRGDIGSVDEPAANYIPQWQGTSKEAVLIRHLLSMASGLEFKLVADNLGMVMAKDMSGLALDNPLVNTPGVLWEYNNHTVQVIEPVLRNATGEPPDHYADMHLWEPIGMTATWAKDKTGHPAMYMNVKASCRDHARFGYLFLKQGCWDGQQVLSEAWVEESTSSSTTMNKGYGYWWWLNGELPTLDSVSFEEKPNVLHPFAPHDAFCAVGLGSQMIEVIPSLDMVVVRLGPAPHEHDGVLGEPVDLLAALMQDGHQVIHNGVLERVIEAVVD